jgi:hypothetical protein
MSKTLRQNKGDEDKFVQVANALANQGDWELDKKHVYRRMVLACDARSWLGTPEDMEKHYRPISCPAEGGADGPGDYRYSGPRTDSPWAITGDHDSGEVARTYMKSMTNRVSIAKCLRSKNNLSAVCLDGIEYLFLKLGEFPQIEFIRKVFKECIRARNVPETWKTSRTVFILKKGEQKIELEPWY